MSILDRFNKNGVEATLNAFCALLEDTLSDKGHPHKVTWEGSTMGCINIVIGGMECYTIIPNTNEWIITYKY